MSEPMGPDQFSAGDNVISADGEKIGTVAAVHMSWLLVEKGIIFVSDFHVPFAAIARYDRNAGEIHLSVTKSEAMASGWDKHPDDRENQLTGSDTVLTGAATTSDTGNVIAEIDDDERPLQPDELRTI